MAGREEPDYYQILGVSREASLDDIKQAYHRLAARFHPDVHPDDAEAEACLRSLNQAYALLKDPLQRARYDRRGAWGLPTWRAPASSSPREWLVAIVEHLLAVQRHLSRHKPQRGADFRYTLQLTPEDCLQGRETQLTIPHRRWCPQCLGSRMANGLPPVDCAQCQGRGEVRRLGWVLSAVRSCERCRGRGVVITNPCRRCAGQGSIRVTRTLRLDIPAGVKDGSRLRVRGEGGPGRWGGAPGDLYIDIRHSPPRTSPRPP
jgi:molecular chaperone DnaJ